MEGAGEEDRKLPATRTAENEGSEEPPKKMRKDEAGSAKDVEGSRKGTNRKTTSTEKDTLQYSVLKKVFGEEGLIGLIAGFLNDLYRLDALEWIEKANVDTCDDVTTEICQYLQKFDDEDFCEKAVVKLWDVSNNNYDDSSSSEERDCCRERNKRSVKQLWECNGHNLVLQKMKAFPMNIAIQQSGGLIFYEAIRVHFRVNGETRSKCFGPREENSLLRFLASANTVQQVVGALENHRGNKEFVSRMIPALGSVEQEFVSGATKDRERRKPFVTTEFFEGLYQSNMPEICLISLKDYPEDYLIVLYGIVLLKDLKKHDPQRFQAFLSANDDFWAVIEHAAVTQQELHPMTYSLIERCSFCECPASFSYEAYTRGILSYTRRGEIFS